MLTYNIQSKRRMLYTDLYARYTIYSGADKTQAVASSAMLLFATTRVELCYSWERLE